MRNSITPPTHIALTQEQAGKIDWSLNYAKAILTLIQHDSTNNEGDEPDEFFSSTRTIKTAISAVVHFLEVAEENRNGGIYCNINNNEAFKPRTDAKLKRIEQQRLQQSLPTGGEND